MTGAETRASKRKTQTLQAGGAGEITVLPLDLLHVDHLYQRDLIMEVVDRIAANWDIVTAGTIVVSRRADGTLYVVDGQHRFAAAKLAGETEILAQVVDGLTAEEEAHLRIQGNYKRSDRINEVFRARVFAGDPTALALQEIAHRYDTEINFVPDASKGLNAISSLEHLYNLDNGVRLSRVFAVIKDAWGEVGGPNASSAILKGLAWFLDRHSEEIDRQRLIERMRMEGPAAIGRSARNHKAALGGTHWINTYRALVEVYNYNLRENSRLEWRTNRSSKFIPGGSGGGDSWA